MAYAGQLRIHDADAHIFETPDWLIRYADPDIRARLKPLDLHGQEEHIERAVLVEATAGHDDTRDAELLTARNWDAPGAFDPEHRKRAMDALGYESQLVFSTYSHLTFINHPGAPAGSDFTPEVLYGAVRAHNRGMVDFCSKDPRLLPVGWAAIDVPELAISCCEEALQMGCAGIELPSYPTGPLSLTHPDLHPVYRMLEAAGRPLLFHVGGGGRVVDPVFGNNGRDRSIVHQLTVIGISAPVEMAVSALVLDGVFEKFPDLMCGVIEHGASWVPGFIRRLDSAVGAFEKDASPNGLRLWPSEYVRRNVRFTPFPFEDVGWLIRECGGIFLFGSDYPHDEGGQDPIALFEATLAGCSPEEKNQFYRTNFEQMMGRGLTRQVRTAPPSTENFEVYRKKALMRLLARDAAGREGLIAERSEIHAAVDDFRRQNGLHRLADTLSWMADAGVTEEMLARVMEDAVLLEKMADVYADRLTAETELQAKVSMARQWIAPRSAAAGG